MPGVKIHYSRHCILYLLIFLASIKYVGISLLSYVLKKTMTLFVSGEKLFYFSSCKPRWRTWAARCSHLVFPIFSISRILLAWQRAERGNSSAQTLCWINQQLWRHLCFHPDLRCRLSVNILHTAHRTHTPTHKSVAISWLGFCRLIFRPTQAASWGRDFIFSSCILILSAVHLQSMESWC